MSLAVSNKSAVGSALRSAFGRFVAWWLGELSSVLPPDLRRWWRLADNRVTLRFDSECAVFEAIGQGSDAKRVFSVSLASGNTEDHQRTVLEKLRGEAGQKYQVVLVPPADRVLCRTLKLPMALEENLRQAVGFELDRFTPFRTDLACYDVCIVDRDPAQRQISVRLYVVEKVYLNSLIEKAQSLGVSVTAVTPLEKTADAGISVNLLPESFRHVAENKLNVHWQRLVLVFLCLVLIAGFLLIPIVQKRSAAIGLLPPLAEARAAAHEADAQRDKLKMLVDEHNRLIDKKWASPSSLLILEELSRRLGDDTFVTELVFDGKSSVQIQGESASAATLIEGIENSPLFMEVSFKSQLTKLAGTPVDRFHIGATLEGDAKPKPPEISTAASSANPVASPSVAPPAMVSSSTTARAATIQLPINRP